MNLAKGCSPRVAIRFCTMLFDLDGTLIDTKELIVASFRHAIKQVLGRDYPDEVYLAGQGRPLIDQMRSFDAKRAEELAAVYSEFNYRYHERLIREFPGVRALLADLVAAGVRLGVVTSKKRRGAELGLRHFGLEAYLSTAVFMEDTQEHKPHPAPVREALRRLGVRPEEAVMVGDSPFDIESALAAGTEAVGVAWGAHPPDRLREAGAAVVCYTVAELRAYLLGSRFPSSPHCS